MYDTLIPPNYCMHELPIGILRQSVLDAIEPLIYLFHDSFLRKKESYVLDGALFL